ncbi:hypothetical protein LJB99_00430 [Deltaproteobacteria bacterium OttesenSCG-928-K17]|nr:hypothetical protein [Deltaproteobacteria bacterium OttesenSCG-928-K17]
MDNLQLPDENSEGDADGKKEPNYPAWRSEWIDYLIIGAVKGSAVELRLFDIDAGRQVLGKRYEIKSGSARAMANHFSNAALEHITGTPGVFGSEIVFASGPAKKRRIMKTTFGGEEIIQVSEDDGSINTQPAIAPDGSMAWTRRKDKGSFDLLLNGRVVSSGVTHLSPAFKPDGSLVAAKTAPAKTSIYDFSVTPPKAMADLGGINLSPTFSPDGSQMAFASNKDGIMAIYITSTTAKDEPRRLASGHKATDPAWSPTGEYIAFVMREKEICIIRPDGTGFRQLTGDNYSRNYSPSFSPDGRLIVFSSDNSGRSANKSDLYIMGIDNSYNTPRLLMPKSSINQEQPRWRSARPEADSVFPGVTDILR